MILTCGEPYPIPIPENEGAIALFLIQPGNFLQLIMPGMTAQEEAAINFGMIKAGLLYDSGAMLIVFQFHSDDGRPLMAFEAPFDARLLPADNRSLPNIENSEQRLPIDIHAIDEKKIFKAVRRVSMPPDMTLTFLLAVQDQLASIDRPGLLKGWLEGQPAQRQYEAWVLEN